MKQRHVLQNALLLSELSYCTINHVFKKALLFNLQQMKGLNTLYIFKNNIYTNSSSETHFVELINIILNITMLEYWRPVLTVLIQSV